MGISRDSRHKHRATGGRFPIHQKKRKSELGRPAANTKLGGKRIRLVRCMGGNIKFRALKLESGNFNWSSENISRKCRILDVLYNASNNELVRTKTLVKNAIISIDATPFRQWFSKYYGVELGKKKSAAALEKEKETEKEEEKQSRHVLAKHKYRQKNMRIDSLLEEQLNAGRVLACVSSRPGQSGRCDGYILEGAELQFYKKRMDKKKHK